MNIERRKFFQLLAVGAAAASTGALTSCSEPLPEDATRLMVSGGDQITTYQTYDVLIIGSGIAGLSAAMPLSEQGRSVMIAEKDNLLGGESYASSGIFKCWGSKMQTEAGVTKTAQNEWNDRKKALEAAGATDWQIAINENIYARKASWVDRASEHYNSEFRAPSEYLTDQNGTSDDVIIPLAGIGDLSNVMTPIRDQLAAQGVNMKADLTATNFITDPELRIRGARFYSADESAFVDVVAKKVIVATGGYASNQTLINTYLPSRLLVPCCTHLSDGYVLKLCMGAKAALADMDKTCDLISNPALVDAWALFAPLIAVDPFGKRFVREDKMHACANACADKDFGYWWTIFDKKITEGVQSNSAARTVQKNAQRVVGPCNTIEELASAMQVDKKTLSDTVTAYEKGVQSGKDALGKTAFLEKLNAPYYAIKQQPARFRTVGGLVVNAAGQVMSDQGNAIDNLYACGSAAAVRSAGLLDNAAFGLYVGECVLSELSTS